MLILDYDGVLIDSITEVAITSFNSINENFTTDLKKFPKGYAETFKKNRFHVQRAGDFLLLATWCLEKNNAMMQKDLSVFRYDEIQERYSSSIDTRTEEFFRNREKFIAKDEILWNQLSKPIQPIWDELKKRAKDLVILTNKNRDAVLKQTCYHQLDIDPDKLFSGDNGAKKVDNLKTLHEKYRAKSYHFIDDSLKNLLDVREASKDIAPVTCYLAGWGYIGPEDKENAIAAGFDVIEQEQALQMAKELL